jgi:hypothetical protein
MMKLSLRLPSGSARAVIAAAGLAVVALFIAVYGNAQARSDREHDEAIYNPLAQAGWDAAHRPTASHFDALTKTK